jgi:TatA/E family protein of Tat protein translocase
VPGLTEILVIMAIAAVFLGPGKLPRAMEALGQGVKQFRRAADEVDRVDEAPRRDP